MDMQPLESQKHKKHNFLSSNEHLPMMDAQIYKTSINSVSMGLGLIRHVVRLSSLAHMTFFPRLFLYFIF